MIDIEKCQLVSYPAPVLKKKALPVETFDDTLAALVDRMFDIMVENKGIGLAAPQVGLSLRLFVMSLDGSRESARVYINPVITPEGQQECMEEGCLSVPGIYTTIKRYKECTVQAQNPDGSSFTETIEGLHARCVQHEYDHLEGITIVNRMGTAARIVHRRQIKKLEEQLAG